MSKEIAQTVGGRKIAWLIAIMAAFAVLATLGTQWRDSEAALPATTVSVAQSPAGPATVNPGSAVTYTMTTTTTGVNTNGAVVMEIVLDPQLQATTSTVTCPAAAVGGAGITWTAAGAGTATLTCTSSGVLTASIAAGGVMTATASAGASGLIEGPVQARVRDADNTNTNATNAASIGTLTIAGVTGSANVVAAGMPATVTFNIPAGLTYCSDATLAGANPRVFAPADQTVTGLTAQLTTPSVANNNAPGTHTVTVVDDATVGGTVTISTHLAGAAANSGCSSTQVTLTAANFLVPELRNMSDVANTVLPGQDFSWNVRGSRHTVCLVAQNTGIDLSVPADGDAVDLGEPAVAVQIPGITLANINIVNGGYYANPGDTDPDVVDLRVFVGDGTATGLATSSVNAGLLNATCFSWVSTDAGDQQINVLYTANGLQYNASWDTDNDNNDGVAGSGPVNRALIKEWNRLEDSTVTLGDAGSPASVTGNSTTTPLATRTIPIVLNPASGLYQLAVPGADVSLGDIFRGSHTNTAGQKEGPASLAGVNWTVALSGCGALVGTSSGTTTIANNGAIANTPAVSFNAGPAGNNCGLGSSARVTFTGTEPGPLGSGTGVTVTEIIDFNFAINLAEKKVFLAWAGQRIILEADWRLAPGDNTPYATNVGPTPNGICPFGGPFTVQYIKGGGPGNFLQGLYATINGSDEALVTVDVNDPSQTLQISLVDNDIISDPQDNCISRVLFESEQPGQVDVEAFVVGSNINSVNATKVAFVVYYMKINTINVSLASQFEKPSHNNSTNLPDWTTGKTAAPANPWDASKDDADNAVDWNVSKDILVRGRVTGWFLNENPSGRAADTSNEYNVLPANRWIMPNDWAMLAGGPKDPADGTDAIGTAEQFRPYYDIMFAPNNTRGLSLATPEGVVATQLTFVATGNVGIGSLANPIRVVSCANLTVGLGTIAVGTTSVGSVLGCAGGFLVVSSPLIAAADAGTGVFLLTTVPFEGPYSVIDIVGLASAGFGGAALSNYVIGNIRDTALGDGDVDWFDAPMPETHVSVALRGTGYLKTVLKDEVYYLGTPNNASLQIYTNPYYITNIPGSPFIPAVVAGGGYLWDSWGLDGPGGSGDGVYRFWEPVLIDMNSEGIGEALSSTDKKELGLIRTYTGDVSATRDMVVYTDNHGEFMVAANGDFKTILDACATNVLAGGKHCKPGDKVGTGTITATVDYPDFRGKHFPVLSNAAVVTWTWGGYKDVTVEAGETDQFAYVVFHAMDRDGFCSPLGTGANLLHSVLGRHSVYTNSVSHDDVDTEFTIANLTGSSPSNARYNDDPVEAVDFLIDSGEGIIIGQSGTGTINDGKQFATGVTTFSVAENDPSTSGIKEFPLSSLAASGQTDECQAWIKVSNSLLGVLNVLAIAKDDEGNIGFDKIIDLTNTTSYTLNFRWSLITWAGADNISVNDAIKGTGSGGANPGGNDISASVTAIYGWDSAAQQWLGFFPSGVNVPGANDLTSLRTGQAYWIAITGPSSVTWTIASNVN